MIFGIGLPRCAGQTLAAALGTIYNEMVWHSIEPHRWDSSIKPHHVGAVETYVPYDWLERHWPGSLFIANHRDRDEWLASCHKVLHKSQGWNHPLWKYPTSSWCDYFDDYWIDVDTWFPKERVFWWNITEAPTWGKLCDFLSVPVPKTPFPNCDSHGRAKGISPSPVSTWPSYNLPSPW